MSKAFIIGIEQRLPGQVVVFRLDDYFIEPALMPSLAGEANYDDPRSIKYDELARDIKSSIEGKDATV